MINKEDCTKEIKKIAENNVEIKYYLELKGGKKLYIDEFTESYGKNRVDEEKNSIQEKITKVDNYDKKAEKTKLQEKLSEIQQVESKLQIKQEIK